MTREDLMAMGLTEEQAEKVIADHAKGIQAANTRAEKFKTDAQKADELQRQLDEIGQKNMSDLEKEQRAREAAEKKAVELQSQLTTAAIEGIFAKANLSGEEFAGIISALSGLELENAKTSAEAFVKGISKRDESNKVQWQKETFEKTPNPGGSIDLMNPDEKKSAAAEYAKNYSQTHNPQPTVAIPTAPAQTVNF